MFWRKNSLVNFTLRQRGLNSKRGPHAPSFGSKRYIIAPKAQQMSLKGKALLMKASNLSLYSSRYGTGTTYALDSPCPKKIYRLKEDQAFSLSLELGRREKVVRHPV
jgi:hypothetical protein